MKIEKFNKKYDHLGGWAEVVRLRSDGIAWSQIAIKFNLTPEHLWRLNREFSQIDSLSKVNE